VFLERGIRATTAEVAERAGVSEGTLFHRFKTKEAIFRQAMQLQEDEIPELLIGAVDSILGMPAEEALNALGKRLLELGRVVLPLMMMSWSNPTNGGGPPERIAARFRIFIRNLAGFFESQSAAGRMRAVDPEVAARAFLGAIHHYCMTRVMTPDSSWIVPEAMYLRGLVDLILRGALPRADEAPQRGLR
jgi:AcrR family transcriptional regulator